MAETSMLNIGVYSFWGQIMSVPKPQMEEGFSFSSLKVVLLLVFLVQFTVADSQHKPAGDGMQPLSKIQIHRAVYELHENASVKAYPVLLGTKVIINLLLFTISQNILLLWMKQGFG